MHNRKSGVTLIEIAIALVIIGILTGLGASLIGILTKRAKISETKENLNANVEAIISWAAGHKKLPDNISSVAQNLNDSWGKPFYYVVDKKLTESPSATEHKICDRRTTNLKVKYCRDSTCQQAEEIQNVAFVLISGGANFNNQTYGTLVVEDSTTVRVYEPDIKQVDNYSSSDDPNRVEEYDDIVKWVTLDRLRISAGCQGAQIKILNNELPYGYAGSNYGPVGVYAEGGVPFETGGKYEWLVEGDLPSGLWINVNNNWTRVNNVEISGSPQSDTPRNYILTFYVRDSQENLASKALVLTINPTTTNTPCGQCGFYDNRGKCNQFCPSNKPCVQATCGNNVNCWACEGIQPLLTISITEALHKDTLSQVGINILEYGMREELNYYEEDRPIKMVSDKRELKRLVRDSVNRGIAFLFDDSKFLQDIWSNDFNWIYLFNYLYEITENEIFKDKQKKMLSRYSEHIRKLDQAVYDTLIPLFAILDRSKYDPENSCFFRTLRTNLQLENLLWRNHELALITYFPEELLMKYSPEIRKRIFEILSEDALNYKPDQYHYYLTTHSLLYLHRLQKKGIIRDETLLRKAQSRVRYYNKLYSRFNDWHLEGAWVLLYTKGKTYFSEGWIESIIKNQLPDGGWPILVDSNIKLKPFSHSHPTALAVMTLILYDKIFLQDIEN